MRNMSFWYTWDPLLRGLKNVTRRLGWWFLKPGDRVCAILKGQGLPLGWKVTRLGIFTVDTARAEPLDAITPADCAREGFPDLTPAEFVQMFTRMNVASGPEGCSPDERVNRIEFGFESYPMALFDARRAVRLMEEARRPRS